MVTSAALFVRPNDRRIQRQYFRKSRNYWLAMLSEFISPALRGFARLQTPPAAPAELWRKGLLIGSDNIGDILYRSSSLPALTKAFPNCKWHIVAAPPAEQLIKNSPNITDGTSQVPTSFVFYISLIRARCFDVVICYGSVKMWKELSIGVMARIPDRVDYTFKGFSGLIVFYGLNE